MIYEGQTVSGATFQIRRDGEFVTESSVDYFANRRVVVFGLPGAFTPTCSEQQLPGFEKLHKQITAAGIDDIYCVSVNDSFVMNAWFKQLKIKKVKAIPDGNGQFTESLGLLVDKLNLGFGKRSWRYAMVLNNGMVEKMFVESGIANNVSDDPYVESTPENVLEYLGNVSEAVVEETENLVVTEEE